MTCKCIDDVNKMLADRNTRFLEPILLSDDKTRRLFIETEQIERGRGKAKATAMFTTFCPFCGVKQEEPKHVVGNAELDQGSPNHFDPNKRGFSPR